MKRISDVQTLSACLEFFDSSAPRKISERVGSLSQYAHKLISNANNYFVERDKKIAGFISFYSNSQDTAYLSVIAVAEEYKGCGIGSEMLAEAVDIAKNNGMKRMRLEVDKQNMNAINFYKKNNFAIENEAEEKSFYMIKEL